MAASTQRRAERMLVVNFILSVETKDGARLVDGATEDLRLRIAKCKMMFKER